MIITKEKRKKILDRIKTRSSEGLFIQYKENQPSMYNLQEVFMRRFGQVKKVLDKEDFLCMMSYRRIRKSKDRNMFSFTAIERPMHIERPEEPGDQGVLL